MALKALLQLRDLCFAFFYVIMFRNEPYMATSSVFNKIILVIVKANAIL